MPYPRSARAAGPRGRRGVAGIGSFAVKSDLGFRAVRSSLCATGHAGGPRRAASDRPSTTTTEVIFRRSSVFSTSTASVSARDSDRVARHHVFGAAGEQVRRVGHVPAQIAVGDDADKAAGIVHDARHAQFLARDLRDHLAHLGAACARSAPVRPRPSTGRHASTASRAATCAR